MVCFPKGKIRNNFKRENYYNTYTYGKDNADYLIKKNLSRTSGGG